MTKENRRIIYFSFILTILIILFLGIFFIYANKDSNNKEEPVFCTEESKLCLDGSYVSRNPNLNCGFDPCPEGDMTFCNPDDRNVEACIEIYQPVCGWSDPEKIQCIKYPCAQTYFNSCFGCMDSNVLYWTLGKCP